MDKLTFLGFTILELSKLLMYGTYYDKLQPNFGEKNLQLHYMDTHCFALSVNTKDIIKDSKNLENEFDFSILNENHELFSKKKNKKVIGKLKMENLKKIWVDEFFCRRSKVYAIKCQDNSKYKTKKFF